MLNTTILSYSNLHHHGELFANMFKERRQSFISRGKRNLPEAEGMEFDQYDMAQSRWVAIHDNNQIMAGLRLTPTTAQCGMYSYMIRDAQRGILGDAVPQELLYEEAPVAPYIWECTRAFVRQSVPQAHRRHIHAAMVDAMVSSARDMGATQLVALTSATWPRWLGKCGLDARATGPVLKIDDGKFQCISINLAPKMH